MGNDVLKGHHLVYFGPGKWDGLWRNRHQLMSRFAQCNKVLYVEPVVSLSMLRNQLWHKQLRWNDFWQAAKQSCVTMAADNLYIYHSPVFFPISGRFPLNKITWWAWKLRLKLAMKKLGPHRPIIWLSKPTMGSYIGSFNEKLVIYHVVDEYLSYGNMDVQTRAIVEALERKVLEKVDLVIVVSKKLLHSKKAFNEHTYLVPNGVDYASYDRVMLSNNSLPSDIARLPRPVIGYSGLISRRLDLNLLQHLAITHPEWSIALIGAINDHGCKEELRCLWEMKNAYFLGLKEIKQVPYYVKAFDACLVPYAINEQTENLSPLKLYDFMAAGKPIVATNFPAAQEFKDVIYLADSQETFALCVEKALHENNDALSIQRRRIASQNTWEHRVEQISGLIEVHLPHK